MHAVIITGGKGTRVAPYTDVLPKGLLPIGGVPLLEVIVRQLSHHRFKNITMACGHLAPVIQSYFRDGSAFGVNIRYIVESTPLGTAGPLKQLGALRAPTLVLNCAVLTTLSFREFHKFHCLGDGSLTIAALSSQMSIQGLQVEGDKVLGFVEKTADNAPCDMGIYMMDPQVLDYIPPHRPFEFPDLVRALLADGKDVRRYASDDFWLNIGTREQYGQAIQEFGMRSSQLFPGDLA